jgi:hypothetical protein
MKGPTLRQEAERHSFDGTSAPEVSSYPEPRTFISKPQHAPRQQIGELGGAHNRRVERGLPRLMARNRQGVFAVSKYIKSANTLSQQIH